MKVSAFMVQFSVEPKQGTGVFLLSFLGETENQGLGFYPQDSKSPLSVGGKTEARIYSYVFYYSFRRNTLM